MRHYLRIVLGIGVVIGAFMIRSRSAVSTYSEGSEPTDLGNISIYGQEVAPSSIQLAVIGLILIGAVMILLGIMGVIKQKR